MTRRETASQIEEQASAWVIRIDREGYTPDLSQELDAWLALDTRRKGAFLRAQAAWTMLDRILPTGQAEERSPDPAVIDPGPRRSTWHRRRLFTGAAAALAASLVGVLVWSQRGDSYATEIGEIRRLPLADGSVAALNTGTSIDVKLGKAQRLVRLEEGEVWFQVSKDVARPFLVEAGRVRVRALGTAFSVRRQPGGAEVRVTEGLVVAWADGAEGHQIRLRPGEQAFVADNAAIERAALSPSAVDRALAWRSGKIDLAGASLAEAVAEFNRYNKRRIVIGDPKIAAERLYGVFATDNPESFASAVQQSLEIPVDLSRSDEILIGPIVAK